MQLSTISLVSANLEDSGLTLANHGANHGAAAAAPTAQAGGTAAQFANQLSSILGKPAQTLAKTGGSAQGETLEGQFAHAKPNRIAGSVASPNTAMETAAGAQLSPDVQPGQPAMAERQFAATGKSLPVSVAGLPVAGAALPRGTQENAAAAEKISGQIPAQTLTPSPAGIAVAGQALPIGTVSVTAQLAPATQDADSSVAPLTAGDDEAEQALPQERAANGQPALIAPTIMPLVPAVSAAPNTKVAADGAGDASGEAGADAGSQASADDLPQAKSRSLAPRPAELDVRRAAAPAAITWDVAEKLAATPQAAIRAGQVQQTEKMPLAQVSLDIQPGKASLRAAGLPEGEGAALSTNNRLAASQPQSALATATETTIRTGEGASSPLGDTSFVSRAGSAPLASASVDPRGAHDIELANLVDRLVESRVQARADRSQIELPHPDFGRVTLSLGLQANDKLSVDLPGAPQELRQAVGQALNSSSRSDAGAQNSNSNTSGSANSANGSASHNDAGGSAERQQGEARDNARQQENRRGDGSAQTRGNRSTTTTSESTPGSADESRRGVLA